MPPPPVPTGSRKVQQQQQGGGGGGSSQFVAARQLQHDLQRQAQYGQHPGTPALRSGPSSPSVSSSSLRFPAHFLPTQAPTHPLPSPPSLPLPRRPPPHSVLPPALRIGNRSGPREGEAEREVWKEAGGSGMGEYVRKGGRGGVFDEEGEETLR